jgi:steroid delta-isomerase-like uncharacterized protein
MKKILVVITLVLFAGITFSQTMSAEEMKVFIENYIKAVTDADMSAMDEFLSPDMKHHAVNNEIMGIEAWKYLVAANKKAYPDWTLTIDELIISGNKTVAKFTSTGTNTGKGSSGAVEPTGKKITYSGVTIFYFVDGKINKERVFYNVMPILAKLGYTLMPPKTQSE